MYNVTDQNKEPLGLDPVAQDHQLRFIEATTILDEAADIPDTVIEDVKRRAIDIASDRHTSHFGSLAPSKHSEILTAQPQLVTLADDSELRCTNQEGYRSRKYHQVALYINPDYSRTVAAKEYSVSDVPNLDEPAENTEVLKVENNLTSIAYECIKSYKSIRDSVVGKAVQAVGIEILPNTGPDIYSASYASPENLSNVLDRIRAATGFAPTISIYEGGEINAEDMATGLEKKAFLVPTDPWYEQHDILSHFPAMVMLTEGIWEHTANRTKFLVNKLKDAEQTNDVERKELASKKLSEQRYYMDVEFSHNMLRHHCMSFEEEPVNTLSLKMSLAGPMFSYDTMYMEKFSEEHEQILELEARALIERVKAISKLLH